MEILIFGILILEKMTIYRYQTRIQKNCLTEEILTSFIHIINIATINIEILIY